MELSRDAFERTVNDFRKIADEHVQVEFFSNAFYVYGSELATLRILKKYRNTATADAGFSKSMKRFYFRLETPLFNGEFSS